MEQAESQVQDSSDFSFGLLSEEARAMAASIERRRTVRRIVLTELPEPP
jgi:hypothetical protein